MSSRSDQEYFGSRAIAERTLSEVATDPVAASIHARLAECYEKLAGDVSAERPVLRIVPAQPLPDCGELPRAAAT